MVVIDNSKSVEIKKFRRKIINLRLVGDLNSEKNEITNIESITKYEHNFRYMRDEYFPIITVNKRIDIHPSKNIVIYVKRDVDKDKVDIEKEICQFKKEFEDYQNKKNICAEPEIKNYPDEKIFELFDTLFSKK